MSYYAPKSSEINNLYTTGGIFGVLDPKLGKLVEYQGYYHVYYNGTVLTGRNSNDLDNKGGKIGNNSPIAGNTPLDYLIEGNEPYLSNSNSVGDPSLGARPKLNPTKIQPRPTLGDYDRGFFRRYFYYSSTNSKENVNFEIGETNLNNYNKIISSDPSLKPIFKALEINWRITSNVEEDVIKSNQTLIKLKFKNILNKNQLKPFINSVGGYSKWWRRGN